MKEWWNDRSKWQKRGIIVGVVFVLLVAIGSGAEETADEPVTTTTVAAAETTTTAPPDTTTTQAPTTTTVAETTTTRALTPEEEAAVARIAFLTTFEQNRQELIDLLSDDINIQTVDRLEYLPDDELLILDVTSNWSAEENQVDGAWELTRLMSELWGSVSTNVEAWEPVDFQLINSGTAYECSGEFMLQLADVRAGRSDWESECGGQA